MAEAPRMFYRCIECERIASADPNQPCDHCGRVTSRAAVPFTQEGSILADRIDALEARAKELEADRSG